MVTYAPELTTERDVFFQRFPVPPEIADRLTEAGKREFIEQFITVRNAVETDYYARADQTTTPGKRTRKFFGSMVNPILGKKVRDVEQFYETYGRLMRWAWLSIGMGIYNEDIQQETQVGKRLHLAQANTIDVAWRPALHHITELGGEGLIVEVGSGRGNSVMRLAKLLPKARIISITISPEQHEIVTDLVNRAGLDNVEVRLGDIFEPDTYSDLIGQADAVGAVEVTSHFEHERKAEGIAILASLLRPGSPLCLMDFGRVGPSSKFIRNFHNNQAWYFGDSDLYAPAFEAADLEMIAFVDTTPDMVQSFEDTAIALRENKDKLREEFGSVMAWLWPRTVDMTGGTLTNLQYAVITGIKH